MFTYTNTCALRDIPYHYYFKLQVETINYMNSMENTVNKPTNMQFLSEFCHFSHFNDKRQTDMTFQRQKVRKK